MRTPRTAVEMKSTPREGVPVVEAAFAEKLESELHAMALVLEKITCCGGIGSDTEDMYEDARHLLNRHSALRLSATRQLL